MTLKTIGFSLVMLLIFGFAKPGFSNVVFLSRADTTVVKGTRFIVLDENDVPVAGASLTSNRTKVTVVTDTTGTAFLGTKTKDEILVGLNNTLLRRFIAAKSLSQIIRVSGRNLNVLKRRDIVLTHDIRQSAALSTSSNQAVYNQDLVKSPVTSVKNALTGRLAGLLTNQTSGRPGFEEVNLLLRGQNPLVLIDGIPRNLTMIDLEEIESVTVLKDAVSSAMLGLRSSNGAIAITTKRGFSGAQQISFTAQNGVQSPIKMPRTLNAFQYASLYNEALTNGGSQPIYTAADLEAYRTGSDPVGHPDVDWQKVIFKDRSPFSRYDLNFRGGGNTTKYYVGVEYQNQKGQFNESDINEYSTNTGFSNYTIRSNVDINLTPKMTLGLHLFGRIGNYTQPGSFAANIFRSILSTPNNAYPIYNENGSYGGTNLFQNNILAQSISSGYFLNYRRDIITDFTLKRKLDEVTPGLWVQALVSFYSGLSENTSRTKSFAVYRQTGTGSTASYQLFGNNGTQGNSTSTDFQNRQSYVEGAIGYKRDFGLHQIDAQIRATTDNVNSGPDLVLNYYGGSGRATYSYDERYVTEISFGLNRTNRYPSATPMGFFPAVGLSWNITKESFMPKMEWLNDLKLFGSYGRTGNDASGYFVFQQYYVNSLNSYFFGTSAASNAAIRQDILANPNVTWEKGNKLNLGLKTTLFKNCLFIQAEYFNNKYFDLLTPPNLSTIVGTTLRDLNIGANRFSGYELQLNWQQSLGNFSYFITGNASTLKSKVLFQNEVFREFSYQNRTGLPVGQPFGYIATGLFQNQAEINASPTMAGYSPVPGDIRYQDLNGDGVINQFDQTRIGSGKPLVYYGANLGFSFAGFDFSALIQGVANRNLLLTGGTEWEFQYGGFGQAFEHHLERWTQATATTATYPRLTAGTNFNNHVVSSFWMRNGSYLRLKNIELGYTIPSRISEKIKVSSIRIFVNSTNLWTSAAFDRVDPETNGSIDTVSGFYPNQRVFNGGLSIKL